jgi:predicted porin
MNKKLSLAVAGAVLAFSASAANAGITIPAGDWTVDIGGNVNAFYTSTSGDGADSRNVRTGLLPSALGIGGKTRQNDLDIAFQFTFFVGADDGGAGSSVNGVFNGAGAGNAGAAGANSLNVRQAFGSFGDASWGTIKFGRDLGIYGSDAILSDMTLLGVGTGAGGAGGSSTLGRIGSGYIYADWVGQISYASPNWNGFSFAVGLRDPWTTGSATADNDNMGYEGKVTYEWAGDFSGKVWLGAISQKFEDDAAADTSFTGRSVELGGKVNVGAFGLVGYVYDGKGVDNSVGLFGLGVVSDEDADGGYVQATFTIPGVGTKLGLSYGESNYDLAGGGDHENKSWIAGAYHPLTKSLNLVAEYTDQSIEQSGLADFDTHTVSLGAIMFF